MLFGGWAKLTLLLRSARLQVDRIAESRAANMLAVSLEAWRIMLNAARLRLRIQRGVQVSLLTFRDEMGVDL